MELMFVVYFAGIVGNITAFLLALSTWSLALALCGIIAVVVLMIHGKEISKLLKRTVVCLFIAAITASGVQALMPSEKTVYMMLGAFAAQTALTSDTAGKVMQIVNEKLDTYIKETSNVD